MDARHGSPSANQPARFNDSDSTVRGLVGLQQQNTHRESPMSMTSVYSGNEYVLPLTIIETYLTCFTGPTSHLVLRGKTTI